MPKFHDGLKPFFAYSLVFLLLLSSLGFYPLFIILKKSVQKEVALKIETGKIKEITELRFDKDDVFLKSIKDKNEFRFNGEMYDVIQKSQDCKGNIIIFCYKDTEENKLYSQLAKHVGSSSENHSLNSNSLLLKYLQIVYPLEAARNKIILSEKKVFFPKHSTSYKNRFREIFCPPPELKS